MPLLERIRLAWAVLLGRAVLASDEAEARDWCRRHLEERRRGDELELANKALRLRLRNLHELVRAALLTDESRDDERLPR